MKNSQQRRRVVVTGIGLVTPLGLDVPSTWAAARAGKVGIGPLTKVDIPTINVRVAGEVRGWVPEDYFPAREARRMDLVTQYGVVAAREAFAMAGLVAARVDEDGSSTPGNFDQEAAGVIASTGIGGLFTIEKDHTVGMTRGFERVSPFFVPMSIVNITAGTIAIEFGLYGQATCVVTACAASTNGIGDAFRVIRDGYQDLMIAGGTESSVTEMGIAGFSALRALSNSHDPERASIPFDKDRDGFVLGEGAGMLVLEELEHARARGATILAEITGYAATCDAYHITAPHPEARQVARCMTQCLADGGHSVTEVDYINAHGTSTQLNDVTETRAIRLALGEHADRVAVSSTKSMTGHLLGGSGAVEAALTILALRDQVAPPTATLKVPDPECDLDYVPGTGRPMELNLALSNSLGFGGHNACLAFRRWTE
ncbi:MAG: beta-ketoacyl-ACP synthase II [Clostridiaceae bacterium]|nr:beta-ketoacyl-ACP synthase II [Clostridiaceae bacterium]